MFIAIACISTDDPPVTAIQMAFEDERRYSSLEIQITGASVTLNTPGKDSTKNLTKHCRRIIVVYEMR